MQASPQRRAANAIARVELASWCQRVGTRTGIEEIGPLVWFALNRGCSQPNHFQQLQRVGRWCNPCVHDIVKTHDLFAVDFFEMLSKMNDLRNVLDSNITCHLQVVRAC